MDLIPRALPWADMLMARWAKSQSFQTQREDLYDSLLFWTFRERREYRARGVSNLRT